MELFFAYNLSPLPKKAKRKATPIKTSEPLPGQKKLKTTTLVQAESPQKKRKDDALAEAPAAPVKKCRVQPSSPALTQIYEPAPEPPSELAKPAEDALAETPSPPPVCSDSLFAVMPASIHDMNKSLQMRCGKCGRIVDGLKDQLRNQTKKGTGQWRCNACNVKFVQLNRLFGGWPPAEFKGWSEEDQMKFWGTETETTSDVEKLVIKSLTKQRIERSKKHGAVNSNHFRIMRSLGMMYKQFRPTHRTQTRSCIQFWGGHTRSQSARNHCQSLKMRFVQRC